VTGAHARLTWQRLGILLSVLLLFLPSAWADEKFDTLEVGGTTYSNVAVINKNSSHLFITHSKGFASFRIKELSPELQTELGYSLVEPPKPQANPIAQLAGDPRLAEMQAHWQKEANLAIARLDSKTLAGIGAGLVIAYLLFCYCCLLICRKAGYDPGVWVWIPIAQIYSMLRAARMSGWNFLLVWIPVVGIVWCFKICVARKKSAWLGLLLLLPATSLFVFLYLALADGQESEEGGVVKLQFS
jgi:hypothetical protein